jgi:hypothetical protein
MRQTYTLASKFFAMVHLGYIPGADLCGLCSNVLTFIEKHGGSLEGLHFVDRQMKTFFRSKGLDLYYPVEGSSDLYTRYNEKYRGPYAGKRRKIAYLLSLWFKELADES